MSPLELRVLGFGLSEDGHVRVSTLPSCEESRILLSGYRLVITNDVGVCQLSLGEGASDEALQDAAMVEQLLKLG